MGINGNRCGQKGREKRWGILEEKLGKEWR